MKLNEDSHYSPKSPMDKHKCSKTSGYLHEMCLRSKNRVMSRLEQMKELVDANMINFKNE